MRRRRTRTVLAAIIATLGASLLLPANLTSAGAATSGSAASLGPLLDRQVRGDLAVTAARVESWMRTHPRAGAPEPAWVRHRLQHTGFAEVAYRRVAGQGYCLRGAVDSSGSPVVWWSGTGMDGTVRATFAEMSAGTSTCSAAARSWPDAEVAASLKADVRNAATAAETHLVDHPHATTLTLAQLHSSGFTESPGNTVGIRTEMVSGWLAYCLYATNPDSHLNADRAVWYDSLHGGLQSSYGHPTSGTCAAVVLPDTTGTTPPATALPATALPAGAGPPRAARPRPGGVAGVITAREVEALMIGDLDADRTTVLALRRSTGHLPAKSAMHLRLQRTGTAESLYLRAPHGRFCLIEGSPVARGGWSQLRWMGTGTHGARTATLRQMEPQHNACGWVLRNRLAARTGEISPLLQAP